VLLCRWNEERVWALKEERKFSILITEGKRQGKIFSTGRGFTVGGGDIPGFRPGNRRFSFGRISGKKAWEEEGWEN
jgi:hypothetical protein